MNDKLRKHTIYAMSALFILIGSGFLYATYEVYKQPVRIAGKDALKNRLKTICTNVARSQNLKPILLGETITFEEKNLGRFQEFADGVSFAAVGCQGYKLSYFCANNECKSSNPRLYAELTINDELKK